MDKSLHIVLGMTIAYAASLLGMIVAWISYRRRKRTGAVRPENKGGPGNGDDGRS